MKADNKHPAQVQGHAIKETAPKTQAPAKPQQQTVAHPPAHNQPAVQKQVAPKTNPKPVANAHADHKPNVVAHPHPEKQKQEQAPKQKQTQQKVPQQQQQQQPKQDTKQQPIVAQKAGLEVKRTIKLPQMMAAVEEDKQNKKVSFILDKTGNAFTFFKYKGTTIDVSDMLIQEHTNGKKHEDNVETARKQVVCSLNIGDNFVISTDIASTDLNEFFKSKWFIPESIFSYDEIVNPKYFREHLLKPDEDHDGFGNKGNFYPKDSLALILLYTLKDHDAKVDFEEHLTKLGLGKLKDRFAVTIIEQ